MPACKITVLKRMLNTDLAHQYRVSDNWGPCPFFEVGQEYLVNDIGEMPEEFPCGWAWNDIDKIVVTLMSGGGFSQWLNEERTYIACCTDGIKPVVFKLEAVDM